MLHQGGVELQPTPPQRVAPLSTAPPLFGRQRCFQPIELASCDYLRADSGVGKQTENGPQCRSRMSLADMGQHSEFASQIESRGMHLKVPQRLVILLL